jgi:hypothetical protein
LPPEWLDGAIRTVLHDAIPADLRADLIRLLEDVPP